VLRIKSSDPVQTYSASCDVFSLGVIYHILMFRKPVFEGKDVKEVIKKNCDCDINFESEAFKTLSPEALDFFKKVLTRNPS
jgi:calcium-dependent protein kinase